MKQPCFGLLAEGKARWCSGCGAGHGGAVNVVGHKYRKQGPVNKRGRKPGVKNSVQNGAKGSPGKPAKALGKAGGKAGGKPGKAIGKAAKAAKAKG